MQPGKVLSGINKTPTTTLFFDFENRLILATFVGESSDEMAAEMEVVTASDIEKMIRYSLSMNGLEPVKHLCLDTQTVVEIASANSTFWVDVLLSE